ncbi:cell division protein FtsL [Fluviibacter phosphoraccumulans]|jgi:cell division protein FtsL|uniref:Cell division protein FtsL n=1 Tax=Fluviibacter phosphoraccumulans TaxID=1751046 RepID=A0A679IB52_9RHOO|nr:cell division protein FtsL [Fluviibacter phosphoraccumulans]BBU67943.1 cell division protein FtsL [Fluviibacter phosphoraccumulans]BBU70518.1 cell division protein FtsL [Fluviibacter phosphoraccumulans]BCA66129.1 cell division protein FtsL [Fluviibacter phosphoraccumulans]
MRRLNLLLIVVVLVSAIGVITSQHQARKRLQALEQERDRSNNLEVEFGQLQLEMSSWAAHTRIEKIAREKLGMQPPDMKKVQKLGVGQ